MGIWNKITNALKPGGQPAAGENQAVRVNTGLKDQESSESASVDYDAVTVERNSAPIVDSAPPPKRTIKPLIEAEEEDEPEPEPIGEATGKLRHFKNAWNKLSPKHRQRLIIIGAVVGIFIVITGVVSLTHRSKETVRGTLAERRVVAEQKKEAGKMRLLSERVERDLWVGAEGQNIQEVRRDNQALKEQIEEIKKRMEEKEKAAIDTEMAENVEREIEKNREKKKATASTVPPPLPRVVGEPALPVPPMPQPGARSVPGTAAITPGGRPTGAIRMIEDELKGKVQATPAVGSRISAVGSKQRRDEWISTGAFMRAVLLNGIDAPTAGNAQSEPYPVLMSITDMTTMPNRFKLDMRECFIVGAGYGNLSDERAYIRTERLSCIRKNGQAIDFDITGHVIGEDGKLGVRGRLVSKQGQQIAMALFAGTLAGFSQAVKPTGSVKLDIGEGTDMLFSQAKVGDVLASGGLGGVSSALDRVADYFLKMAEKIFPIIEVDAGRTIEVVILKGRTIEDSQHYVNIKGD